MPLKVVKEGTVNFPVDVSVLPGQELWIFSPNSMEQYRDLAENYFRPNQVFVDGNIVRVVVSQTATYNLTPEVPSYSYQIKQEESAEISKWVVATLVGIGIVLLFQGSR